MVTGNRTPITAVKLDGRLCWNCYNFEDRRDIDGTVLCAKGHAPGSTCEDFMARNKKLRQVSAMEVELNEWFCWNCDNLEDRGDIDRDLLCTKGHRPEGGCEDFVGRYEKLREIGDNNRYERVSVKAILMENKNPTNFSDSLQNTILRLKNRGKFR